MSARTAMTTAIGSSLKIRGEFSETAWRPPNDMTEDEWLIAGMVFGRLDRAVQWWIGDWWAFGEHRYGDRRAAVEGPDWTGPSFQTCMNAATVCRAFGTSRRREVLSFKHHAEVAALPAHTADRLLDSAVREFRQSGEPPPATQMRQEAKRIRRAEREEELAEVTERVSKKLNRKLYSVIYADPPWRFEPRSRETGMDRSPDNHYPTMTVEELCQLDVPAAKDCVLFLWRTAPMLEEALQVMKAWGFSYRTEFIWTKPHAGTGYWNRNRHEVLMVCVRGDIPAPAPGDQFDSVIPAKLGKHSQKPAVFVEMIDEMFPTQTGLEMFARSRREGWEPWGNEVG